MTADDVIGIRRPHLFFCMRGRVYFAKDMLLIRSWSKAERQSSGLVFLNILDGGPPELVTQMSTWPKRASTAASKAAAAVEAVTSTASWKALWPVVLRMCASASSRARAVRAQIPT